MRLGNRPPFRNAIESSGAFRARAPGRPSRVVLHQRVELVDLERREEVELQIRLLDQRVNEQQRGAFALCPARVAAFAIS
jgi:tRNA (Thr-GGU) A37 N-methylase